jgi:hypothetical protein
MTKIQPPICVGNFETGDGVGRGLKRPTFPDRFQFVQDDSCHWYAIPAGKLDEFNLWVASFDNYRSEYKGEEFDSYRLDYGHPSSYTFTGLQKDK